MGTQKFHAYLLQKLSKAVWEARFVKTGTFHSNEMHRILTN
jgi:hypothetical protein